MTEEKKQESLEVVFWGDGLFADQLFGHLQGSGVKVLAVIDQATTNPESEVPSLSPEAFMADHSLRHIPIVIAADRQMAGNLPSISFVSMGIYLNTFKLLCFRYEVPNKILHPSALYDHVITTGE
jgi:hypothetical protein